MKPRLDLLKALADHIESPAVTDDSFDMATWRVEDPACGTVACAIGHACDLPKFTEAGLTLALHQGPTFFNRIQPVFGTDIGFAAVEKCLNLTLYEACFLFNSKSYRYERPTRREVAARIRDFIREEQSYATEIPQADSV